MSNQITRREIDELARALELPHELRRGTQHQIFHACVEHARQVTAFARGQALKLLSTPPAELGDFVAAPGPSGSLKVRSLTEDERAEMRECLQWVQSPEIRIGEPSDDHEARGTQRVEEARRRWPKVAELIGF